MQNPYIPLSLTTAANGLTFELDRTPELYAKYGPQIIVMDGAFRVCSYCLSTLRERLGSGVCVTAGTFEKYREIDAGTLARIIAEADAMLLT